MSEKVLGFLKEEIIGQNKFTYIVEKDKLVPVVSLEWLVNYSNKKIEREEKEGDDLIGEAIIEHYKELISAAKKQAVEEK